MAATPSLSGVHIHHLPPSSSSSGNRAFFPINCSARARSPAIQLSSLIFNRKDAIFNRNIQRLRKHSTSFIVRCDASSTKITQQVFYIILHQPVRRRICCDHKSRAPKAVYQDAYGVEPVGNLAFDPFLNTGELRGCDVDIVSSNSGEIAEDGGEGPVESNGIDDELEWEPEEIEAISSLFKGRIPQKPGKLRRKRPSPLPLPLPYKNKPLGLPTRKNIPKPIARQCILKQVYKSPSFLIGLAKQIKDIPEEDVFSVLNRYARFLRKGSLSMTVRELGHLGLPERALQVFCWAQQQPHLFPDDRILASTVEVLASAHELKVLDLDKFIRLASKSVYEAMVRGFIKGGDLKLAWKLLCSANEGNRILDASVYTKLILALGKNPDKSILVLNLLEELAEREHLNLTQQDCTAVMKVCVRIEKFEIVEMLYDWFRNSGGYPSIVMYTTMTHSLFSQKKYREAMAIVWEMEGSGHLLDLPAYRVAIKLFVALNDLPRTVRYFSKLKEGGFSPTFDIYRNVFQIYASYGRLAKCMEVCREAEMAGFYLEEDMMTQLERHTK